MAASTPILEAKGSLPMHSAVWQPSIALSPVEQTIVKPIKRAKLFWEEAQVWVISQLAEDHSWAMLGDWVASKLSRKR